MRNIFTLLFLMGVSVASISADTLIVGTASVYSENFEGNKTASGETFSHQNLTAAHRTLPFGTYVRLTRSDIGKSVIVKINDRGPYVNNCIVDISAAAAKQLDFKMTKGEYEVQLEVVNPDDLSSLPKVNVLDDTASRMSQNQKHNKYGVGTEGETVIKTAIKTPTEYGVRVKSRLTKGANDEQTAVKVRVKGRLLVSLPKKNTKVDETVSKQTLSDQHFKLVNYSSAGEKFGIQVASLKIKANSLNTIAELKSKGINDVFLNITTAADSTYEYKVIVGAYKTLSEAAPRLKLLKSKKIGGFIVKI